LDAIESGEPIGVSMACRVDYDVCSGCGNRARNRDEYCTKKTCKYGGCKENLGKTFSDGHTLRVFNPEPIFFDISYVAEPADRIAYSVAVIKQASVPDWICPRFSHEEVKQQYDLLKRLAKIESEIRRNPVKIANFHLRPFSDSIRNLASKYDHHRLVYGLAQNRIILPFEEFLQVFAGASSDDAIKVARKVRPYLQYVFNDLLNDYDCIEKLMNNKFVPQNSEEVYNFIGHISSNLNTFGFVKSSCVLSPAIRFAYPVLNRNLIKLAKEYAQYQLASLLVWPGDPLPLERIVIMNFSDVVEKK
jgi:hypothetical protein